MPELRLSGSRARVELPRNNLQEPLPMEDPPLRPAAEVEPTRFAQLENGLRICAVERQGLCASLGLFVHAGSRYQTAEDAAVPHMLELMAFRSSDHLSHIRTLKTLEQLGATASCRVGREDILYQVETLREYVPAVLPLLLANVLCPSLLPEEVAEAHQHIPEIQANLEENTESLLSELLHVTAYKGGLGHALYASEENLPMFTPETLRKFVAQHCRPDRMILVGVNTEFEELCKWTARAFAEHPPVEATPRHVIEPPVYAGGDLRLERPNPLCHVMLGWEVEGGWNGEMLAAITVLQMFLGGGGSFSTGGPGKGMHTRLYTHVLNRHHWVESCQASSVMYADTGLFTVYATVEPPHADKFVNVLAGIFSGLTRIRPEELQRAKNALKSSIHMNLEMRAVMVEDVGRQLVLAGKVGTASEFGKMVDAVTADHMRAALRHCLTKPPSVIAYGAVSNLPSHDKIAALLKPGLLDARNNRSSPFAAFNPAGRF